MLRHRIILGCCVSLFTFTLIGCTHTQTVPPKDGAFNQMHHELQSSIDQDRTNNRKSPYIPNSVSNALMPSVTTHQVSDNDEGPARFNVSADKIPAKSFFMGLVQGTPYNMVISSNVNGTISLDLKNVTIEEAMDAVRDAYGYDYRKTSYGYEVLPPEIQTQIFNVNYLDVKRSGKSLTEMTSGEISQELAGSPNTNTSGTSNGNVTQSNNNNNNGGASTQANFVPTSSVDTTSVMNFWKSLNNTLKNMLGTADGRSVVVNGQAGVVIVHAYPKELHMIARYLDRIQANMSRQVILEAKILEVSLDDGFQSGIDWNLFGQGFVSTASTQLNNGGVNQVGNNSFPDANLTDFNSMFAINILGNFGTLIKLLQTQGNVQVLSSPRISTVNNQKAVIKVGEDQFFCNRCFINDCCFR